MLFGQKHFNHYNLYVTFFLNQFVGHLDNNYLKKKFLTEQTQNTGTGAFIIITYILLHLISSNLDKLQREYNFDTSFQICGEILTCKNNASILDHIWCNCDVDSYMNCLSDFQVIQSKQLFKQIQTVCGAV